jgi:hypothetical protein
MYSPSSTSNYQTCPVLWTLKREGWEPRVLNYGDVAALMGRAVALGAARIHAWLQGNGTTRDQMLAHATNLALAEVSQQTEAWRGREFASRAHATLDNLPGRIRDFLPRYAAEASTLLADWQIQDVELTLGSGSRLDLAAITPEGWTVADLKCKLALTPESERRARIDYGISHQLRHYCHEYGEQQGVTIDHYYIILCTLDPFDLKLWRYPFPEEDRLQWLASSKQVWQDMAEVESGMRLAVMNRESCYRGWLCEYFQACHEFRWDETLSRGVYAIP